MGPFLTNMNGGGMDATNLDTRQGSTVTPSNGAV